MGTNRKIGRFDFAQDLCFISCKFIYMREKVEEFNNEGKRRDLKINDFKTK